MRGFWVAATTSLLAITSVWGCEGGASEAQNQGGTAGAAGASATAGEGTGASGGTQTDGGTEEGGSSSLSSKRYACREYLTAACERRAECAGRTGLDACLDLLALCPDYLFSDGSTRTVQGTLDCAQAWRTLSCENVETGIAPACSTPGTRQPGEACRFSSQCESLACSGTDAACGVCLRLAAAGESCDGVEVGCSLGQRCNGTCEIVEWTPHEIVPPKAAGEECQYGDVCVDGYMCLNDPMTEYLASVSRCQIPPGPGSPCAYNVVGGIACASDSYCSISTCQRRPAPGETCGINSSVSTVCELGDECDENRVCIGILEEGEPCGAPSTRCAAGTECSGGRCVATDELTIFPTLCGGA
jgi:hypothetical protein